MFIILMRNIVRNMSFVKKMSENISLNAKRA